MDKLARSAIVKLALYNIRRRMRKEAASPANPFGDWGKRNMGIRRWSAGNNTFENAGVDLGKEFDEAKADIGQMRRDAYGEGMPTEELSQWRGANPAPTREAFDKEKLLAENSQWRNDARYADRFTQPVAPQVAETPAAPATQEPTMVEVGADRTVNPSKKDYRRTGIFVNGQEWQGDGRYASKDYDPKNPAATAPATPEAPPPKPFPGMLPQMAQSTAGVSPLLSQGFGTASNWLKNLYGMAAGTQGQQALGQYGKLAPFLAPIMSRLLQGGLQQYQAPMQYATGEAPPQYDVMGDVPVVEEAEKPASYRPQTAKIAALMRS